MTQLSGPAVVSRSDTAPSDPSSRAAPAVERMQWPLPFGSPASPAARDHVTTATGRLDSELAYAAGSLTSEIVTAVLLRGRTDDMWLEVMLDEEVMRVDVTASFARSDVHPTPIAGSRGGMLIVDALATDWGVVERSAPSTDSLRIWFRLSLS